MKKLLIVLSVFIALSCRDQKFDIVIQNATVYDGTGSLPIVQDVAISGDTITMMGDIPITAGTSVIDAQGLALAPGFIDTHSHHDWGLEKNRDASVVVSQGITTIIVGQDGGSNFPLQDYYKSLVDSPIAVNIGSYSGHNTLRDKAMGKDFKRPATDVEVEAMRGMLTADLREGALGLSTGLEYDPGIYSSPDEILSLAKVLPEFQGRYISHMRSEDRYFWKSINEVIAIGKETGVPVQISHFKLAMRGLWGKADSVLQLLEKARGEGVSITADIYPYAYWSSTIRVLFPDRNFGDLQEAEFILREVTTPEGIIFSYYEPNPEYNGRSLMEVAAMERKSPAVMLIELIKRLDDCDEQKNGECYGSIVATSMGEADIRKLMTWKHTNICSDGASSGRHPRGSGAFTKVLRYYVREQKVLSMEEAIHKMTFLSAQNLGIRKRGLLRPGYYADLVLFNPKTVADQSTIEDPQKLSTGIEQVWVNGAEVFAAGKPTGKRPGAIIRRE